MRFAEVLAGALVVCACTTTQTPPRTSTAPPPVAPTRLTRVTPIAREASPLALANFGARRLALVADEDEDAIHTLDLNERTEIARTNLTGRPTRILIGPNGEVIASLRDSASVVVMKVADPTQPLRPVATLPTADEPIAMALSPDDATLWVASGWGRTLQSFDLASRQPQSSIPVSREPRAVAISRDGAYAYVGYMSAGEITVVNLRTELTAAVALRGRDVEPTSRHGRQVFGFARVDFEGDEQIFAPYLMVDPGEPSFRSTGYGGRRAPVQFAMAGLDAANGLAFVDNPPSSVSCYSRFDDPPTETLCALPRAIAADPRGGKLFVACLAQDKVIGVDPVLLAPRGEVEVPGAPSALAVDGARHELFVLAAFGRRVSSFSLPADDEQNFMMTGPTIGLSHIEGKGLAPDLAEGRTLFHHASTQLSIDGRSCASCHPDGREDGFVWSTPNGPRQTIFLAGRLHGPFGWQAKNATLAAHIKTSVKNIHGEGLTDAAIDKLSAWLAAMPPPPRKERPLSTEEELGRQLFLSKRTKCATCHLSGDDAADGKTYDVGSRTYGDNAAAFRVPSLKFLGATAPYFHDGRYPTLLSLVKDCDGKMGTTKGLTFAELNALERFLRTL